MCACVHVCEYALRVDFSPDHLEKRNRTRTSVLFSACVVVGCAIAVRVGVHVSVCVLRLCTHPRCWVDLGTWNCSRFNIGPGTGEPTFAPSRLSNCITLLIIIIIHTA